METADRIKILQGKEIHEVKNVIRKIDKNRRLHHNGISFAEKESIAEKYEDNDFCVLGTGWYMFYRVENGTVMIECLQSLDDKNTLTHAVEITAVLKELLRAYRDDEFKALLNKNSLRMYNLALKKGYIEPISFASERYDLYGACSFKTSEKYKEQTADVENKIIKFTPQN